MKKILLLTAFFSFTPTWSQCFTSIKVGQYHVVARKDNGTLWSWGSNGVGQLNTGNYMDSAVQLPLVATTDWQYYGVGIGSTFLVRNNGTLWGVGTNLYGALGVNSSSGAFPTLTQVGTATNWKEATGGGGFESFGIRTNGTLWGWGINDYGQLGDGTFINRLAPVQIGTASTWKTVVVSGTSTVLALRTNGTLWGWGLNNTRLIGDGSFSELTVPTQIDTATNWDKLSVGFYHALGLKTDGTLWSWGGGDFGQLGDVNHVGFPMLQVGTATWKSASAGFLSSYGVQTNGTLWAWGRNHEGQLGDGTTTDRAVPTQIGIDTDWAMVAGGFNFAVALKTNGALYAWGAIDPDFNYGQLGNGTTTGSLVPIPINVPGCVLSTTGFEQEAVTVYPNPARNEVRVDYSGLSDDSTLVVYDVTGRLMHSQTLHGSSGQLSLDTDGLANGVYVVVIKTNNTIVLQKKLLKE
jgi:alpha-tubulin suppressor-like RCC1 family protein